nr:hypothetical protein CFP56_31729 [Quercus suber]
MSPAVRLPARCMKALPCVCNDDGSFDESYRAGFGNELPSFACSSGGKHASLQLPQVTATEPIDNAKACETLLRNLCYQRRPQIGKANGLLVSAAALPNIEKTTKISFIAKSFIRRSSGGMYTPFTCRIVKHETQLLKTAILGMDTATCIARSRKRIIHMIHSGPSKLWNTLVEPTHPVSSLSFRSVCGLPCPGIVVRTAPMPWQWNSTTIVGSCMYYKHLYAFQGRGSGLQVVSQPDYRGHEEHTVLGVFSRGVSTDTLPMHSDEFLHAQSEEQ